MDGIRVQDDDRRCSRNDEDNDDDDCIKDRANTPPLQRRNVDPNKMDDALMMETTNSTFYNVFYINFRNNERRVCWVVFLPSKDKEHFTIIIMTRKAPRILREFE
jgi:hypothetical protein